MGELYFILLISGVVFGFVGSFVAKNRGLSQSTGFLFGFFLGPVGIIVVALLSAHPKSQIPTAAIFAEDRDITSDRYQLWLTQKYDISRNDTLGRYVVRDRSFGTLEEALQNADGLEEALSEHRTLEAGRSAALNRDLGRGVIVILLAAAVFFAGKSLLNYMDHRKAIREADQALAARRSELSTALASASLPLMQSAELVDPNFRTSMSTEKLRSSSFLSDRSSVKVPESGVGARCAIDNGSVYETDRAGKEIWFTTSEVPQQVRNFYEERLKRAGFTSATEFHGEPPDRLEYAVGNQLVFVDATRLLSAPVTVVGVCILNRDRMEAALMRKKEDERADAEIQARRDASYKAVTDQIEKTQKLIDSF